MSNWRPEGWENPHTGFYPTSETFEEGADAMLEAISEKIEKYGRIKSYWVKAGSKKGKKELTRLTIADMEQAHGVEGIIEIASKRAAQAQLQKILTLLKK